MAIISAFQKELKKKLIASVLLAIAFSVLLALSSFFSYAASTPDISKSLPKSLNSTEKGNYTAGIAENQDLAAKGSNSTKATKSANEKERSGFFNSLGTKSYLFILFFLVLLFYAVKLFFKIVKGIIKLFIGIAIIAIVLLGFFYINNSLITNNSPGIADAFSKGLAAKDAISNKSGSLLNKTAALINKTAALLNKTGEIVNKSSVLLNKSLASFGYNLSFPLKNKLMGNSCLDYCSYYYLVYSWRQNFSFDASDFLEQFSSCKKSCESSSKEELLSQYKGLIECLNTSYKPCISKCNSSDSNETKDSCTKACIESCRLS